MISASEGAGAAYLMVLIGLYLVPSIVAVVRKVPNTGSVIVVNVFLGWSIIGWVVALAMAARSVQKPPSVPAAPPRPDGP